MVEYPIFRSFFFYFVVPVVLFFAFFVFFDFDQCDRRCAQIHGKEVNFSGFPLFHKCLCYEKKFYSRSYENTESFTKLGEQVCGEDGKTYDNLSLKPDNVKSLHSGFCGWCSNEHDIKVMKITKDNLTEIATSCGKRYLILGYSAAKKCMERKVGFTPQCTRCWVENMGCTISHCLLTCIKNVVIQKTPNNKEDGELNDCLKCDEVNCGPEFMKCVGANRRKSGIKTDIKRERDEVFNINSD